MVGAAGHDFAVSFKVVEREAFGVISPLLARREGVNGELQAFVGIFLRLGFAGLVVGDDYLPVLNLVDAVNAPHHSDVTDFHIEIFFGVQNIGDGIPPERGQEIRQLLNTLGLVEVVLIAVLDAGLRKIIAKELDQIFVRAGCTALGISRECRPPAGGMASHSLVRVMVGDAAASANISV